MKSIVKNVLPGLVIILALMYQPAQAQQKEDVYQLDIKKSKLFWAAPKNQHKGFILFSSGTLNTIANGWPTQGAFSINMNSMQSTSESTPAGKKKVDDKMRSDDFFAVAKYPTATMLVKNIVPEGNGTTFNVFGELTIKNVTKPIIFKATLKQNGAILTAKASTNISRANWNVSKPSQASWNLLDRLKDNMIANDIPVELDLVFVKQ